MASNMIREDNTRLTVVCSHPTTPLKGQPVRFGSRTGVALTNEATAASDLSGNAIGNTTVDFGARSWNLSVKGVNDAGNSAVAVGDELFYVDADVGDGTGFLSKKSSGYFFGYAAATVTSGATANITVDHQDSPGSGTLGSGTVGTTNLASGAVTTVKIGDDQVTAAKLTDTMAIGTIQLALGAAREIVTNAIPNAAAIGGLLASDTTPILERVNGATDKKLRIRWAASNSDALTWDFAYPVDLDDTVALEVHMLAAMGGATDIPVIAVNYFEGLGDTNAGGNTAAVTGTTIAEYSRVIAAGDIGAAPNGASVEIVPAAHTTDTLLIYSVWIEYARK